MNERMAGDGWKTEWEASGGVLRGWINEEASRKQARPRPWMPLMMAGARRLYVRGLKERRVQRRVFRRAEAEGEESENKARGFSLSSYPSAHAVASRSCACGESETNDDSSFFFTFIRHLSLIAPAFQPSMKMNRLCTPGKVSVNHVNGRRECSANSSIEMIILPGNGEELVAVLMMSQANATDGAQRQQIAQVSSLCKTTLPGGTAQHSS
jgi:hypothetical protein